MTSASAWLEVVARVGAVATTACLAFVAYVLLGYPLLLWLATRARRLVGRWLRDGSTSRPQGGQPATLPSVTVLIAAFNEEGCIEAKLRDTLALDYPPDRLHVVVAADGSSDATAELARAVAAQCGGSPAEAGEGARLDVLHEAARRGKTAAILRAMPHATGEIVVFSDANNRLSPTALRRLVAPFTDAGVGIVGGAKTIARGDGDLGDSEGAYWRYEDALKRLESELGSTVAVAGEILAYRRSLFRPPPVGVINDDFWLAADTLSRGYRVLYAPEALSVERVAPTREDELARRSRIVAGRYQALTRTASGLSWARPILAWKLLSHKFARPLLPFAMLGALFGSAAWALGGSPTGLAAFLLQALGYSFALLGPRLVLPAPARRLAALASYLVAANWAALTGLAEYLRGRQTSVWRRVPRRR